MGQTAISPRQRSLSWRSGAANCGFWAELARLVTALDGLGYRGDCSFEVFNDDYQQLPLPMVAERARRAAVWLAEDVLRRSVPLQHTLHRTAPIAR